jgi:hypothetical protein
MRTTFSTTTVASTRRQSPRGGSGTSEVVGVEDEFGDFLNGFRYVPDAFIINRDEMQLDFFEVEITSLMTDTKLRAYGEFTTIMSFYGVEFRLFSVNQHGHINEVPLFRHYMNWIKSGEAVPAARL